MLPLSATDGKGIMLSGRSSSHPSIHCPSVNKMRYLST